MASFALWPGLSNRPSPANATLPPAVYYPGMITLSADTIWKSNREMKMVLTSRQRERACSLQCVIGGTADSRLHVPSLVPVRQDPAGPSQPQHSRKLPHRRMAEPTEIRPGESRAHSERSFNLSTCYVFITLMANRARSFFCVG